jgi:hypothetical protein
VDYEKEMIWIKPIKEAEAIKNAKAMKLAQKIEEKKKKKLAKKIAKANLKAKK